MLDLLLFLFFVFLTIRGWTRGFVKEAMDLLGVVVGIALAFRLSRHAGVVVEGITGASPIVARLVGGMILFAIVGAGAAVAAHYLHKVATLPGLRLGNRLTGAGLALGWGLFLSTLVLSMASLFALPTALASQVDGSAVAQRLTDPGGVAQTMFTQVAGDEVVEVLLSLEEVVGARRVIVEADETVTLAPAERDDVTFEPERVRQVFELVNQARSREGLAPLQWSRDLATVAAAHSVDMYTSGYFSHVSPTAGGPAERIEASGLVLGATGENLALAADLQEAHSGLLDSPGHRANLLSVDYDRVGIAAHEGPLGLMLVQVFGGR